MATPESVDASGEVGVEVSPGIDGIGTLWITRWADTTYRGVPIGPGRWYRLWSSGGSEYGMIRILAGDIESFTQDEVGRIAGSPAGSFDEAIKVLVSRRVVGTA